MLLKTLHIKTQSLILNSFSLLQTLLQTKPRIFFVLTRKKTTSIKYAIKFSLKRLSYKSHTAYILHTADKNYKCIVL